MSFEAYATRNLPARLRDTAQSVRADGRITGFIAHVREHVGDPPASSLIQSINGIQIGLIMASAYVDLLEAFNDDPTVSARVNNVPESRHALLEMMDHMSSLQVGFVNNVYFLLNRMASTDHIDFVDDEEDVQAFNDVAADIRATTQLQTIMTNVYNRCYADATSPVLGDLTLENTLSVSAQQFARIELAYKDIQNKVDALFADSE